MKEDIIKMIEQIDQMGDIRRMRMIYGFVRELLSLHLHDMEIAKKIKAVE